MATDWPVLLGGPPVAQGKNWVLLLNSRPLTEPGLRQSRRAPVGQAEAPVGQAEAPLVSWRR